MDSPPPALHRPVLLAETIELLNVRPEGIYIDATLGGGGHAEAVLQRLGGGRLLGIDRDPVALAGAQRRLEAFGERLVLMKGNFVEIDKLHAESGLPPADGLLADLGMSSLQLEDPSRGFSFSLPGPLDMRMDPETAETAAQLVNRMREQELADLIFKFGWGPAIWKDVAFYTLAGGIVGALLAAIPGLVDLISLQDPGLKRTGIAHMLIMLLSVGTFCVDFWLRWKGTHNETLPLILSIAGVIVVFIGGWIGAELVHVHGVSVAEKEPNITRET